MTSPHPRAQASAVSLLEGVGKGPPILGPARDVLRRMLGVEVGLDGISRLFQPGFLGVRAYAVEVRLAPDQAVELTLVGVARDGRPVWTGTRAFAYGRDGSLEIHRGFDEIAPEYQSRNITVDLMQRELDILALLDEGPSSRLTIDAEGVGRYVCALHGFVFADETEEGPPVRSTRALAPSGDRAALLAAVPHVVERVARHAGVGKISIESAVEQARLAKSPWDFAKLTLPGAPDELAEGHDGEMGVGRLGHELLLAKDTPPWRAALYLHARDERTQRLGAEYRRRKTARSEARLAEEIQTAREMSMSSQRATAIRGLRTLAMIAPPWVTSDIRALTTSTDRRLAAVARQVVRRITGADQGDTMLAFAKDTQNSSLSRALVFRVLAEHYPSHIADREALLRVDPDARIQRSSLPLVAARRNPAPNFAAILRANPWADHERPGLLALRLELIERLTRLAEPSTLPALMEAFRAQPPPPPAERLALSQALVAFPDPRAQVVLTEAARRLERPDIP